jgi:hypothetical protein
MFDKLFYFYSIKIKKWIIENFFGNNREWMIWGGYMEEVELNGNLIIIGGAEDKEGRKEILIA